MPHDIRSLGKRLMEDTADIDEITEFVSLLMLNAVDRINTEFAPRQLVKRSRIAEPLPTEKRQLSSYRTRLGTMLEYALSTYMDTVIRETFEADLRLTFVVAHEYPDFYIRDQELESSVSIEMKAVDTDSDEQSARFEVLSSLIRSDNDVVVLVGWEWHSDKLVNGITYEHPSIFAFVVVPAIELARERDESVRLRGGRVELDKILVPKKGSPGELTLDKGNAGKILRLIHQTRRSDAFNLSKSIQEYLQFTDEFRNRKVKPSPRARSKGA